MGHDYGSSFRRPCMVMRNMCTLVALAVGLRMHFTSVAFAAALTSSSPCTGPAHALHVCKFTSLHYAYECSPCMQVHLLGPSLRTVCATMQLGRRYCCHREDQVSKDSTTHLDLAKSKESLFAQSAKIQDNKTFYRTRVSASKRVLLTQHRGI